MRPDGSSGLESYCWKDSVLKKTVTCQTCSIFGQQPQSFSRHALNALIGVPVRSLEVTGSHYRRVVGNAHLWLIELKANTLFGPKKLVVVDQSLSQVVAPAAVPIDFHE